MQGKMAKSEEAAAAGQPPPPPPEADTRRALPPDTRRPKKKKEEEEEWVSAAWQSPDSDLEGGRQQLGDVLTVRFASLT